MSFIGNDHFWQAIQPPDMPRVLEFLLTTDLWHWIVSANQFYGGLDRFLAKTIDYLEDEAVLDKLARLLWREIDEHNRDLLAGEELEFRRRLQSDATSRRLLLKHIVEIVMPEGEDPIWLYDGAHTPLLVSVPDFDWLLDQFLLATSDQNRLRWRKLLQRVFDVRDIDKRNRLLEVGEKEPALKELVDRAEESLKMQKRWQEEDASEGECPSC